MLSEVRKYGLGVTLAHQYIQQADQAVFEAVMGNVGSALSFRVGALDAPLMVGQLEPVAEGDLTGLANYEAYARVMVKGERSGVFSVATRG